MVVRTVLMQPEGLYISEQRWNDPNVVVREQRDAWRWIGGPGWYACDENRSLYTALLAHIPDLDEFRFREYDESAAGWELAPHEEG